MSGKLWIAHHLCACLCLASSPALAQSNGFPNVAIGPSKAEVVGAIVGSAVVIGLVVYLVIPKQKNIEGCVESTDGVARLTNEKDHHSYVLLADNIAFKPGQRLKLKGKKGKDKSGAWQFRVKKMVQDEGTCQGQ
jgi:hypothetical protein